MKICYVSGTRADFGLMERTLRALDIEPTFDVSVLAMGQHLDPRYGNTIKDIEASGLSVHRLPALDMPGETGAEMGHVVATVMQQIIDHFSNDAPDLVLLLGDRGEMVAAGMACVFLGIVSAHFHGGDRSGTVDDQFRRVITSLAHYHFPANDAARDRLIAMGEDPLTIRTLGAPGLDGLTTFKADPNIEETLGIASDDRVATVVFHPVVQDAHDAANQAQTLIETLSDGFSGKVIVLAPNSDAGSAGIARYFETARETLAQANSNAQFVWLTHLARDNYLWLVQRSDVLVGNSSSGIIEAATLGTPVVNIGDRQNARDRNDSVFDAAVDKTAIAGALKLALSYDGNFDNQYDHGGCASRIVDVIKSLDLSRNVLKKNFSH